MKVAAESLWPAPGGKSTLLELFNWLFQLTYGEVLEDNWPLNYWSAMALRAKIALVAQDY